jgi:hypothetical protein
VLTLSVLLNVFLLAGLAYLLAYDPVVATITTPNGLIRNVLAGVVNQELAERHGEEVQSDLVGRSLIDLAAEESNISLDYEELEARWQDWLSEPGTRARIDSGEVTERELRDRLVTLVLLDQLSWNELTVKEQDSMSEEYFKANQREFEQLRLRHIVVESQKDANDIANRLAAGVDFQELARRFSLDPLTREQGGDMGWKSRADLTEDLRAFLFLLPSGAASSPVSSTSGWHIFLVEERRETYKDCKDQVRRELMRRLRPETLDGLRVRFKVERSEGKELKSKLKRPGFLEGSQSHAFDQPATGTRPESTPQAEPTAGPSSTAAAESRSPSPPPGQPLSGPSGLPGPLPPVGPMGRPPTGVEPLGPVPVPPPTGSGLPPLGPVGMPPGGSVDLPGSGQPVVTTRAPVSSPSSRATP